MSLHTIRKDFLKLVQCRLKVAITLRRVNLSSVSHQEERDRISSPDESSICRSVCH